MRIFKYTAIDHRGNQYKKTDTFSSIVDLNTMIKNQGHWVVSFQELKSKENLSYKKEKISNKTLKNFFFQMSMLLASGVSINLVMSNLIENESDQKFKDILKDIHTEILRGNTISDSFDKHPIVFSSVVRNLVKGGEHSATLPETFGRLNKHYEWIEKLIADIRQIIFYPIFVILALLALIIVLFSFVIPKFELIFREGGVQLPLLTQVIVDISHFVKNYWLIILGLGIFFTGLGYLFNRYSERYRFYLDYIKLMIPAIGSINKMICLERFSKNLGIMYSSGISLIESLELSKGLIGNRILERDVDEIIKNIEQGNRFHEAIKKTSTFPSIVQQMVAVGEKSGNLESSLENLACYYSQASSQQLKHFFCVFEPTLIVSIVLIVGLIAAAVFFPVLDMTTAIH